MKTKKIIAREFFILLAFLATIFIAYVIGLHSVHKLDRSMTILSVWIWIAGICAYASYLLIRFIIWAIKTLRKK